ncbi:hypothetical protein AAV833_11075, partial [Geobacillus stearothermophilus]
LLIYRFFYISKIVMYIDYFNICRSLGVYKEKSVLRSFCVYKEETDKRRKEIEDLINELFED